jgi:hypothetical protein
MGAFSSVFHMDSTRSVYDAVGSIPWDKLVSLFLLFQHPENTVKDPDFRFRIFALLLSEVYGAEVFSWSPQKARAAGSSHGSCELVLRFWHFHLPEYPVYPPAASLCDSKSPLKNLTFLWTFKYLDLWLMAAKSMLKRAACKWRNSRM